MSTKLAFTFLTVFLVVFGIVAALFELNGIGEWSIPVGAIVAGFTAAGVGGRVKKR